MARFFYIRNLLLSRLADASTNSSNVFFSSANNPLDSHTNNYKTRLLLVITNFFFLFTTLYFLKYLFLGNFDFFIVIIELFLVIPILAVCFLHFKSKSDWELKRIALCFSSFTFIVSLFFLVYNWPTMDTVHLGTLWIGSSLLTPASSSIAPAAFDLLLGNNLFFYLDGVSLFFILLTTFLFPICILVSWYSITHQVTFFLLILLILEFFLVNSFLVSSLFYFFVFFEAILFPMFFIIGVWGSRDRKIHAVLQFLLYTLAGSVLLFIAIFYIWTTIGSWDYLILKNSTVSFSDQKILFWLMFLSFAFKIPLFPVHIWLPEAHVEAPTFGSIILAGLLLKLGTYGLLRFVLPVLPEAVNYYTPVVLTLVIIGIFYTSFSTTRQLDLKKIIAYSSVGHMGFVILGLFTSTSEGIIGSLYLMLGHGIVSSALFMSVGILYDRYHTRNLTDLRGLAQYMPLFAIFFLIFTLANVSFPGTFNFVAEMSIILALVQVNPLAAAVSVFSIIFIMIYAFWLYNRTMFGSSLKVFDKYEIIGKYMDLSKREFNLVFLFAFLTLLFGFFPNLILSYLITYGDFINLKYDFYLIN